MSLELVNTLASVGTLLVFAATAVAAIVQLRHLRYGNQLQSIVALRALRDRQDLTDAFNFVANDLTNALKYPVFRSELESKSPPDRTKHIELNLFDYFELVGSYVKYHLIDPDVYLDYSNPARYWELSEPAIAIYRRKRGQSAYENFEYLAVLQQDWDASHPSGNYPKGARRLRLADPYLEADTK